MTMTALATLATLGCCRAQMEERWLRDEKPPQCIFGDWLFCLASAGTDQTTATTLANGLFMFIVYVLICVISSRYIHGTGTKWRANFGGSVLLGMVVVQYYHVFMAAMDNYPFPGQKAYRWDCLESTKGGKISKAMFDTGSERALNPCFCHGNATCKAKSKWRVYNESDDCPVDGDYVCFENYNMEAWKACYNSDDNDCNVKKDMPPKRKIFPYITSNNELKGFEGYRRDCKTGQKDKCTREDPCTPCELDKLVAFGAPRCETCSVFNNGDCAFVPGVGPYCWESPDYDKRGGSRKVVPCKQCCTEPYQKDGTLLFVDGVCI